MVWASENSLRLDFPSMTEYASYDYKIMRLPPQTPCEMKPQSLIFPLYHMWTKKRVTQLKATSYGFTLYCI